MRQDKLPVYMPSSASGEDPFLPRRWFRCSCPTRSKPIGWRRHQRVCGGGCCRGRAGGATLECAGRQWYALEAGGDVISDGWNDDLVLSVPTTTSVQSSLGNISSSSQSGWGDDVADQDLATAPRCRSQSARASVGRPFKRLSLFGEGSGRAHRRGGRVDDRVHRPVTSRPRPVIARARLQRGGDHPASAPPPADLPDTRRLPLGHAEETPRSLGRYPADGGASTGILQALPCSALLCVFGTATRLDLLSRVVTPHAVYLLYCRSHAAVCSNMNSAKVNICLRRERRLSKTAYSGERPMLPECSGPVPSLGEIGRRRLLCCRCSPRRCGGLGRCWCRRRTGSSAMSR